MTGLPLVLASTALAYLLGSIPFGLVLTRLAGYGDIRQIGSGNIGATNVLRTGNKGLAALTVLLDGGKGAAAVLLAQAFGPAAAAAAAVGAILGHLFPVWLKFRGGKGVATAGGVLLAYLWPVGLLVLATWIGVAVISRYSSLAALTASAMAPLYAILFAGLSLQSGIILLIAILVVFRHGANIHRLVRGEESKIGLKRTG